MDQFSRITALLSAAILFAMAQVSTPASSQQGHSANLEINLPEVVAEVKAAHDRYNDAINAGDIAVINSTFTMMAEQSGLDRLTWNIATKK